MAAILLIDDDPQVRFVLRTLLEMSGHSVRVAEDGAEGLRLCREQLPDLVVCDVFMDTKDGLETIQELRRLDPAVKLIALSGDTTMLPVAQALGAQATLAKPVSRDALIRCVDAVLARPG